MSASRGAWPYFYGLGLDFTADPQGRGAYGIYAFKNELIYNGFSKGVNPTLPHWGSSVTKRTKDAQRHFGLTADGVLGPATARCLFRKRMAEAEAAAGLPAHSLARIASLESANDPVAQGWADLDDEGILQENGPSNPDLTQQERWTPSFIIPHGATQLASRIRNCGSAKAGVAAWNVGNAYAIKWREAGYPGSGLVVNGQDMFTRATGYYAAVEGQAL